MVEKGIGSRCGIKSLRTIWFKSHQEIAANPLSLPTSLSLENYIYTWTQGKFTQGFWNSLQLTGTAILTAVFASTTMGYVLAKRCTRTWKPLTLYFMMATTVPIQMFMLPLYKQFSTLGLLGSPIAAGVAIAAAQLPMPIFLMRTYFLKLPFDLEEAARVDGASALQVFTKIMMPLVRPGMITVAVIVGLASWNDYLLSSTLLMNEENFTATLRYINLNGTFSRNYAVIMAGGVIMIVPMIVVFLLLQRRFIEGMSAGAVKG